MSRAENAYWKKKLPPGFRYMLEKIGRGVCKGRPKPANVVEYIATYLEFKQSEHAAELAALPEVSYIQKLLAKKARKEASNITAEQGEGTSVRAEAIQASAAAAGATSAAAFSAKEPKGAESKKETHTRSSEDILVKKPAPGGDDKRRSATNLPNAQKSIIEILYPNTSTGKIVADHKKEQVRGASQTSREEIRKETSKPVEIGRQRTSESKSIIKTPSEPAVKSPSQPIVKVPSEAFAPLAPNIKAPSQLLVEDPSQLVVKVSSQSTVKDQSNSVIPQTSVESSTGRDEEQARAAVVLIDAQKEVAHVSHKKTAESIPATKSPSQPTVKVSSQSAVKVPSHSVVPQAHVEPKTGTEQGESAKETIAQIDVQGEVAHVPQQQIAESIPASKAPSQTTVKLQLESFSRQALIENAPSQLVVQAPSHVVVKSPSQPAVKDSSQSTVKVSAHSIVPEPSTGREQEAPAKKTVVQTEADREVSHVSQEHIVESVLAKKSPSQPVVNVPSQQLVKVPSEPLIQSPSQPSIKNPSQLAVKPSSQPIVKTSHATVNVTSQPIAPQEPTEQTAGRELDYPAEEIVIKAEVQREIAQVSHQQIAESILTVKAPSQPTVKAPSQSVINLSQPDVKVPSQSNASHAPVESAEDREVEETAKETVIQIEVQKEIAQVSQQQIAESISTVKTPSQPVVKAPSQPAIKVPSQPTGKASSQQIVKASSHSVVKAASQPTVKAPSQTAVKTSQPTVKVPSQSIAPHAPVNSTAGREPGEADKETTVPAEFQRKVAQVSHQQIAESIQTAKTPSQPVVNVLSQPVVKSPSRPAVKASSQQIVKIPSHSVAKAPSQPTVKAASHPAVKTSQPAVKVSSQRIAPSAPVEQTTDRELEEPAKETILQADAQKEVAKVSQQLIAESISTAKVPSQSVVKTLSQPVVKSPSRPTVKASSQHIVKVPSLPTVKAPSHSVLKAPSQPTVKAPSQQTVKSPSHPTVKAPSQPTVKVPSQLIEPAAGITMDEPGNETVARAEVQREIAQVSEQQITESMSDGKAPSQPVTEVPSQPTVKVPSQLIASLEPMELASDKRQVEPADKTIAQTEESLRRDLPGQPMEHTKLSEVTEAESTWKAEEIAESPLDQPVIISTQVPVAVAEAPANESKAKSDVVEWTEHTLAETMEDIGIPEVTQTGDEGTKVFNAEIDLTFEAETVSSLVAIKAEAEGEKEEPVHIEVDREEQKEPIFDGEATADEHQAPALGDLANETEVPVPQALADGTGQEASLQKTKTSYSHLSFEEAYASVQEAPSNELEISPTLVPTEDTQVPAHAYANESEVPVSHVANEDFVSLQEAPFKELKDSSNLSLEAAHAFIDEASANEPAEQPKAIEAFVREPETAYTKPSAEGLKEELSETSKVVVCHRMLSTEPPTTEAEDQVEVSETSKDSVCQRRLSIDQTAAEAEGEVEVSETSNVAVGPRRLSIDQTATEVEGEVEVSETSKDSVCQKRITLEATIQNDSAETCKVAVCHRMLSVEPAITEAEAEAEVSEDPSNAAVCQRKLSIESTITEAKTQAEEFETPAKEPELQAPWPLTEELVAQAELSENPVEEPNVPTEEPEGYVSNVPTENVQRYIQETFPKESELPASQALFKESTSTAPVLEASSQEHESLASKAPSKELQASVMKTCSKEPEAFPTSEEPLSSALEVPSEETQVASQASEPPANEA